ncbi:MAG: methyl-accepting chemotaxis protein [Parashewanella sp.]
MLIFTLWFSAYSQQQNLESYAQKHVHSISKSYFDSLNTMMLTGTIGNRELLREKITAEDEIKDIRVIRSPILNKLYGNGLNHEQAKDDLDRQALNGQTVNLIHKENNERILTRIEPIRASANYQGVNCLGCHQAKENDILGAIRLDYSLKKGDKALHNSLITKGLVQLFLFITAFIVTSFILNHFVIRRLMVLRHTMQNITKNSDLRLKLDNDRNDEIGHVCDTFNQMVSKIDNTLCSVVENANNVNLSAEQITSMAETTRQEVMLQKSNTSQVAAAMTEMAASAEQVRGNAECTTSHSNNTSAAAMQGAQRAKTAVSAISCLSEEVQRGAESIQQLNVRSDQVAEVLTVISGIAEQTNLLALNAAIEAARAGEQGRGFAVVADEVRTLASRTQVSTEDIRKTIEGLRADATNCVEIMDRASGMAKEQVVSIEQVAVELKQITMQVSEIYELNTQMETAAKEQSQVAETINANVIDINQSSEATSIGAEKTADIAKSLLDMAHQLEQKAKQFKLSKC